MIPTVGEKPPAASKTCGMTRSRSPIIEFEFHDRAHLRGSVPSTASINVFFKEVSRTLVIAYRET